MLKKRDFFKAAFNQIKKKSMNNQNNDRRASADTIIRNHVIWSMGAGLIPV